MASLPFTKMHGLGNDFVLLDARDQWPGLTPEQLQHLANRRRGIGCDQVLIIEPAAGSGEFRYRVFNPDGSEVEQCGNGVRCVARWLFDRGEIGASAELAGGAGVMQTHVGADGQVQVAMGEPVFNPGDIPLVSDHPGPRHTVVAGEKEYSVSVLSMGNPHAVLQVQNVTTAPVEALGSALQTHPAFPNAVNVGFVSVVDQSRLKLRVYERGAGETQACGSGACAAAVAMMVDRKVNSPVDVELPGGHLSIAWSGPGSQVKMSGPASYAFAGTIDLQAGAIDERQ